MFRRCAATHIHWQAQIRPRLAYAYKLYDKLSKTQQNPSGSACCNDGYEPRAALYIHATTFRNGLFSTPNQQEPSTIL
jgi:hypothetical protein